MAQSRKSARRDTVTTFADDPNTPGPGPAPRSDDKLGKLTDNSTDEVRVGLHTGTQAAAYFNDDDVPQATTITPIVEPDGDKTPTQLSVLQTAEGKKGPAAA